LRVCLSACSFFVAYENKRNLIFPYSFFHIFTIICSKPHVASSISLRATIFQNPEWTERTFSSKTNGPELDKYKSIKFSLCNCWSQIKRVFRHVLYSDNIWNANWPLESQWFYMPNPV
jgi:hypothetical protein